MKPTRLLVVLPALLPTLALANPVRDLRATNPGNITALGTSQTAASSSAVFSFNSNTPYAFGYGRARTSAGVTYEFQLVSLTASTLGERIDGYWNVTRDGVAVCTQCLGYAYGLSSGEGKPLFIYVDGGNYQMSAGITSRYDVY